MKIPSLILSLFLCLISFGQGTSIGTAPTLASLTNRPPSNINPVVITQGRDTPGDGKGGMYVWVSGSTSAIDWTNVLGSSLTSTGRWLLSLPSATPATSDSSKVDRANGTGTGLDLTDTDLLGTTRVNGVNLESSLAAKLNGTAAAGMFPVGTGSTTVASSGISTNAARNVNRVMLTATELVATSPTDLMATTGGTLAFVTTTGDTVAGEGARHWKWNPSSTAATNFANAGGPLAYTGSPATGRWEEVKPYAAADTRIMVMTSLYPDDPDGTTNPNDPSVYFNGIYAAAEAAYDPILGPVTVQHPDGVFTCDELIFRGNVWYNSDGIFHVKKRSHPVGTVNRSVATTRRQGFLELDPDGSFDKWGAAGGTNGYYAAADNWYGLSDNMRFTGNGKFIFDQNQKDLQQPLLRFMEVRNMYVAPGVIEAWHNASTNVSPVNSWGILLAGRNVHWFMPIVKYGTLVTQDGFHVCWGRNIHVYGGYAQSGDDSLAFQAEAAGSFTSPPDEPLEEVYVNNWHCESRRARGAMIHAGVNWINAPYTNRTVELRGITVDGVTGTCAVERGTAIQMGNFQDGGGIWTYTINAAGSGYTDGYYVITVGNTGGGSGAQCSVKVTGGQVVRAVMAKVAGVWKPGTGYTQDQAATVASIPGGSGALITGVVFGQPNNRIVNCAIRNFNLDCGSATHDGSEPYGFRLHGLTDSVLGPGFIRITENTVPIHRPYVIHAASNCVVRGVFVSPTQNGGGILANAYPKAYINGLLFDDCTFGPHNNGGQGICKINGTTVGRLTYRNCNLIVGSGMAAFYLPDLDSSKACHADFLDIDGCWIRAVSGATSTKAIDFVPSGGTGNMLGKLRFVNNTLTGITTFDTPAVIQAACTAYEIQGNSGGFLTEVWFTVTQTSGTTTVAVPISIYPGLIDNTTASLPVVSATPYGNVGAWWMTANTVSSATINTASAPGSDVTWGIRIRAPYKPLTGY